MSKGQSTHVGVHGCINSNYAGNSVGNGLTSAGGSRGWELALYPQQDQFLTAV